MKAGATTSSRDLHILTGAPGSGKTTILDQVGSGIRRVAEPAREILAEQRATGGTGTHDRDPSVFVELLLRRSIEKHEAARRWEGAIIFDRGIPDCIAYAVLMGVDPTPSITASEAYRYRNEVFVLEPWEEIYTVDDERTMSFADTLPFHDALVEAYGRAGYTMTSVPRGSVDDQARVRAPPHRLALRADGEGVGATPTVTCDPPRTFGRLAEDSRIPWNAPTHEDGRSRGTGSDGPARSRRGASPVG